jgi:hypothetical protein
VERPKSVFLSVAGADAAWGEWADQRLRAAGLVVEYYRRSFPVGENFISRISSALASCDCVVALLSPGYCDPGSWVTQEWQAALNISKDRPGFLVPFLIERCRPPPLLAELNFADLTDLNEEAAEACLLTVLLGGGRRADALPGPEVGTGFPGGVPPVVPGRPVRLAPRPEFLAGREDLLAELDARLSGTRSAEPQVVALCGLGGAGKTSLALEYAHRHRAELGLVWQFAAQEPTVLAAGFGELAAQLRTGTAANSDPVAEVHAALASRTGDWLLLFDNAADPVAVRAFLPPAGGGQVLITSQNPLWGAGQVREVPVLDQESAAAFLVNRTGITGQQAPALELAGELGGLPLALEQAGAYMLAAGRGIAEYLALFRQRRMELLARGEPAGYDKQVATAWTLAFEQLRHGRPGPIGLLRLLACCAPEAIPLRLVIAPRPELKDALDPEVASQLLPLLDDPLTVDDAVMALRRYSLISPPHAGTVTVHRLVQAVTLGQLPAELAAAWRQAVSYLIEAALPGDPHQLKDWPIYAALVPHAQATLPADGDGMAEIGEYLTEAGNYGAARAVLLQVLEMREREHGPWHPATLSARGDLAALAGPAGDQTARNQYAELLRDMTRVLGPEHPDVLRTRGELAYWTRHAGDAAAARDQYAALLPVLQRVLGPEHQDTLLARGELAACTGFTGDPAGARDQLAELLPDLERVLGPEHPGTLTPRANLAFWTGYAGDPAAARDLCAALVPLQERLAGPEHPYTLTVRANLARWTGEAGDAQEARDQYAALLPLRERICGPEHPATLTDRTNLARWIGEAGDAPEARDQYAALLPVRERVSGPEHPDTLRTRAGLARWTGEAGDAPEARDQYAALLPIRERKSGPEHPDTLTDRAGLARWTGEAGDAPEARDQYAALLPVRERVSGPEHPDTLRARAGLARWKERADNQAESENTAGN